MYGGGGGVRCRGHIRTGARYRGAHPCQRVIAVLHCDGQRLTQRHAGRQAQVRRVNRQRGHVAVSGVNRHRKVRRERTGCQNWRWW